MADTLNNSSSLSETAVISSAELDLMERYYNEWKGPSSSGGSSLIPRFHDKPPSDEENIQLKLREEARSIFLERKQTELLNKEELKELWELLGSHNTPPVVDEEKMIDYHDFLEVAKQLGPKFKIFFTTSVFAKLQQKDPYGRISIVQFFHYAMRKTWLQQSRIGLSLYDATGQGYLQEKELDMYIGELMPTLAHLDSLEETFHSFYLCTAVRKFMFFLDPLKFGKIRITDVLASGFLEDLLELKELSNEVNDKNWFSPSSAMKVYAQYLNLDTDRNGMLSKEELAKYGTGTLTDVFVDCLFQECLTYEMEMDYKAYLDFVLAMENKKDPASLQYFFRVLDVKQKGYLDAFALNYFFRAIQKMIQDQDQPPVLFEDVKDEIFDMVKPADPLRIKLTDLVNSGQGDVVVNILIDLNGFWNYENREVLSAETNEDEETTEC